jgi:hypothetical protein
MLPNFLFPEQIVSTDSEGEPIKLENAAGQMIQLTLGITDVIEQQSLDVSVLGSADGIDWGTKPLTTFPQKFYKGMYTIILDLTERPEIQFLRVRCKVNRWGHWTSPPMFKLFVFAELLARAERAGR